MPRIIVRFCSDFVIASRISVGLSGGYEAFVEGHPRMWEAGATDGEAINRLVTTYAVVLGRDISEYEVHVACNGFARLISCDFDLTLRVSLNEIFFFAHVEQ